MKNKKITKLLLKIALSAILIFTLSILMSCKPDNDSESIQYFKNFQSTQPYSHITPVSCKLGEGTTIDRFDNRTGIYITKKVFYGEDTRFGFCDENKELVEPRFSEVLDIQGNYATVTMPFTTGNDIEYRIGIVKIRGEGSGQVDPEHYGFSQQYISLIQQYTFLDDKYIAILGGMDVTDLTDNEEAIIYDYSSSNGLLEVAKIEDINNSAKFIFNEGHLIITMPGRANIYSLDSINDRGYLIKKSYYMPFSESEFDLRQVDIEAYYLGNNWFVFSGSYASNTEYEGYEVVQNDYQNKAYYLTIRSQRYNAVSRQFYDTERVALVANKYTSNYIKDIVSLINTYASSEYINTDTPDMMQRVYTTSVLPTSEIVKDGYSIVYTYFPLYDSDGNATFSITFQIYDKDASRITVKDVALPVVYVDGYGIQNLDPNFKLPPRDVECYKYENGERVCIKGLDSSTGYDPYLIHSGMIFALKIDKNLDNTSAIFNTQGVQIRPFEYDVISPYFGEYAIGGKIEKHPTKDLEFFKYYRIDRSGNEQAINEFVYSLHYGMYIVKEGDKYKLYNNKGEMLLDRRDYIFVADDFFVDGKFVKSTVIVNENGKSTIYKLS
ncbi:MAG TPA: hypothetical protein PKX91_02610 [Clostridia bacterium]|jgi:hypothetical protein|nr:hypothetical protein [Clostridia bacterium]